MSRAGPAPTWALAGIQGAAPLVAARRLQNPLDTEALEKGELKKCPGDTFSRGEALQEGLPLLKSTAEVFLKPLAA